MPKKAKRLLAIGIPSVILGLLAWFQAARADTVYFKDGRKWEGLIVGQDAASVKLDLGFDIARLEHHKILRIERSDEARSSVLKKELEKKRICSREALKTREFTPQCVKLLDIGGHLFAEARINGQVKAKLLIDTGASVMIFPKEMGPRLGVAIDSRTRIVQLKVADGRKIRAAMILLDSVRVGNAEAKKVPAALLLEPVREMNFGDGLMGMSFMKRFNFAVDYTGKTMTLAKVRQN